ncbi:hypothetical protein [Streptomyces sp. SD15]
MPRVWFPRVTLPRARGPWTRPLVVIVLALATSVLFCAGSGPAQAAEPVVSPPLFIMTAQERLDDGGKSYADVTPCQECPDEHRCNGAGHHGVLGHPPLVGADRTAAVEQPGTALVRVPLDPSRTPGGPRPPDLHELQLLRI